MSSNINVRIIPHFIKLLTEIKNKIIKEIIDEVFVNGNIIKFYSGIDF
jgi:hypothetical protein